jgi:signal transduction histidine kinase
VLLYFAVQIPLGAFIVYLGRGVSFSALLLLPLAGNAVVMVQGYWLYAVNAFIVMGYVVAVRLHTGEWANVWSSLPTILAGLIYIMVFTQMALDEEKSRRQVERLVEKLESANIKLREYADEVEELAIIQERNRLAREIHDGLGHYLTTIYMQLQAAEAIIDKDRNKALSAINKAKNQSQNALIDVRKSVSALRYDPNEYESFEAVLLKAIRPCEWVGITPRLTIKGKEDQLTPTLRSTIFRIVQETVNNTCKYSKATTYRVNIDYNQSDKIHLWISDNGIGTDVFHGGYGLMGLKERIELIDGKLEITSHPNQGFQLDIELPYEKAN